MVTFSIGRWAPRLAPALAIFIALSAPAIAQQATDTQRNAIRQACPADYQAHCANVPAAGQAAFACLQRNAANLSPACQQAVRAVSTGTGAAASQGAASSSTATAPAGAPRYSGSAASPAPMTPRDELRVLRESCGGDFRAYCRNVPLGGGRAIACLRAHADALSPQCGDALSAARSSR
jgi:hypothetical protein